MVYGPLQLGEQIIWLETELRGTPSKGRRSSKAPNPKIKAANTRAMGL
jgi:hypothetical protein